MTITKEQILNLTPETFNTVNSVDMKVEDTNKNCTRCTGCTRCTDCTDCIKIKNGKNLKWVVCGIQLTKEEYLQVKKNLGL